MAVRADERVLARIGFAQRWLDRAKVQCTDGNLTRGVLTLVLADAEVHQAMEAAGGPAPARTRPIYPAAVLLLGVIVSGAMLLTTHRPLQSGAAPVPVSSTSRLSSPVSTLPVATGRATAMSGSVSTPIALGGLSAPARAIGPAALPASLVPNTPQAGVRTLDPSRPPLRMASSHITMPELVDLVLTAERALRAVPAGALSP